MRDSTTTRTVAQAAPARASESNGDAPFGSPEHLRFAFTRAVAATDRAIGYWLTRHSAAVLGDSIQPFDRTDDIDAYRALVRASATAYVRQLKEAGVTPERMVVFVKQAAGQPGGRGPAGQELTSDLVLWSIEAYFDD